MQASYGPRVLLFGADYVWPERTFEIAAPVVVASGGEVVGTVYLPLVPSDFTALVRAVRAARPDYILALFPAVWGDALKALDDAGLLTDDLGIGTTFLGDVDLAGLAGALLAPLSSLTPQYGTRFLVPAFLVVLLGRPGSLGGLVVAGAVLGGSLAAAQFVIGPVTAEIAVIGLVVVLLRLIRGVPMRRADAARVPAQH